MANDEDALSMNDRAGGNETYTVYLLGFSREPEQASARIAEMFRIDEGTAANLVSSAPVAVKRGASRETSLAMEKALRSIGADVDVQRHDPAALRSSAPPVGVPSLPPGAGMQTRAAPAVGLVGVRQPAVAVRAPSFAPGPGRIASQPPQPVAWDGKPPAFWSRVPVAFVVPFLGSGVLWLAALTAMLVVFALSAMAPCLNVVLMPITGAVYFGLMGIYFSQAAVVGLEDDGSRPQPRWSKPAEQDVIFRGGALVLVSLLLFSLPAWFAYKGAAPPVIYALASVPYLYWPMALTVCGITNSLGSLFNPIEIGKGIFGGGIPYLAIVVFGYLAYAGLGRLPALASAFGFPAVLGSIAVAAVGVGYVAGVQGYLMGCLVNSRPEKFEGLSSNTL